MTKTCAKHLRLPAAVLACATAAGAVSAVDLRVQVHVVRNLRWAVMVAICTADRFLNATCHRGAAAAARLGRTDVIVRHVPPGVYAVQVIHDENGNGNPTGPCSAGRERGLASAAMRRGPPRFADAAVRIGPGGGTLALSTRYC